MKETGEVSRIEALHRQQFDHVETGDGEPLDHPPGISTTESMDILLFEAELEDEGKELGNPHIPLNQEALDSALAMLEDEGLEPAWLQ